MRLTFLGADHEVTGSCHFLQACGKNILIDCGMEQGNDVYENQELPVPASDVDYVLLTHAHIDHSGLIPLLYVNGFRGKVYTTEPTVQLCEIMLKDSAHIQMFEAEWRNRKAKRSNGTLKEFVPLYDIEAAINVMKQFVGCAYEDIIQLDEGIKIRFRDVGHLLGSASIEVWAEEDGEARKMVFSGDIGNMNKPIVKNPQYTSDADYVVMESTYGNRSHGGTPDYVTELVSIFERTFNRGGNVVIPSFAVGRTQEILYFIRKIKQDHLIDREFDVYMDSPLAIEATNIFQKNVDMCFDEEAMALVKGGINPLTFPGLKFAVTGEESKLINFDPKPKVILSASGMCEAGRIRHHLKHNLWRKECTVVFAGYQAEGTIGRSLIDGNKTVRLFGETIDVEAHIEVLHDISGHADRDGLIEWACGFQKKPQQYFIVHGSDDVCDRFAELVTQKTGALAKAPFSGAEYDLAKGVWIKETAGIPIASKSAASKKASGVFARLVAAGERLMAVILHNEGGANKDLARFADQINALCDKWDR
jgi:metallo-beta-lactamase family protein